MHENIEINDKYLEKILRNNNLLMELPIQIISNDQTVGRDTIQELKEYNSQPLKTQFKEGEQLVSMMPSFKEAFDLMGDDIVEVSTENESSRN